MKTAAELIMSAGDSQEFRKECTLLDMNGEGLSVSAGHFTHVTTRNYKIRYEFSKYLTIRRILGLVLLFISKIRALKVKQSDISSQKAHNRKTDF